jgi:ABC-type Na+ transport system ATPase subunit NatA
MSISYVSQLVENKEDLILVTDGADIPYFVLSAITDFPSICIVSDRFPLLANLNVIENITLFNMYHGNIGFKEATERIKPYLSDLDMAEVSRKRKESLTRQELIQTYVLRCFSRGCDFIMTDFDKMSDMKILRETLDKIKKRVFLWIMCSQNDLGNFSEFNFNKVRISGCKV